MLVTGILFAANSKSFAKTSKPEEKVYLDPAYSMNFLIDYQYCKNNRKEDKKNIILMDQINKKERENNINLFKQIKICTENNDIYKQQAVEYKAEYIKTVEELKKAKQTPWYKFDPKSLTIGGIIGFLLKAI